MLAVSLAQHPLAALAAANTETSQERSSTAKAASGQGSEKSRLCAATRARSDADQYINFCKDAARLGDKDAAIYVASKLLNESSEAEAVSEALELIVPLLDWHFLKNKCEDICEGSWRSVNRPEEVFADAVVDNEAAVLDYLSSRAEFKSSNWSIDLVRRYAYNAYSYISTFSAEYMVVQGLIELKPSFLPAQFVDHDQAWLRTYFDGQSIFAKKKQKARFFIYVREDLFIGPCKSNLPTTIYEIANAIEQSVCKRIKDGMLFKEAALDESGNSIDSVQTMYVEIDCNYRMEENECITKPIRFSEGLDTSLSFD